MELHKRETTCLLRKFMRQTSDAFAKRDGWVESEFFDCHIFDNDPHRKLIKKLGFQAVDAGLL